MYSYVPKDVCAKNIHFKMGFSFLVSGYYFLHHFYHLFNHILIIQNQQVYVMLLKTFYISFSSGQTILKNNVYTPNYGTINSTTLSLGDFSGAIGYKRSMKKNDRFSIGAELKFFDSTKLDDKNLALVFLVGYHL